MDGSFQIPSHPSSISIGGVTLKPFGRLLSFAANETSLRPQTYRLAKALLTAAPNLVAKDALIEAVWPDPDKRPDSSDSSLVSEVLALRKIFKELKIPFSLDNIKKKGYKLSADSLSDTSPVLTHNNVNFQPDTRKLTYFSAGVSLGPRIAEIAQSLFEKPMTTVPYDRLVRRLWPCGTDRPVDTANHMRVLVYKLRRGLETITAPVEIVAARGEGLKLVGVLPKSHKPHGTSASHDM